MHTGTTIAHYRIAGLLGHGGMGEVYRAGQDPTDEAIYFTEKLVRVWDGADPELAERLEDARKRLVAPRAGNR